MLDITQNARLATQWQRGFGPAAGPLRQPEAKAQNWDAIVGVKGRLTFGAERKWFVPYYLDVGTGESDLTWQAMGGIGYSFGWGDVVGSWRHLDYKMKSGDAIQSMNFNGPSLAAVFHW